MRRLLTGYAVRFNRRHGRSGHLFQNRYKSILVEEDPYLLELVRYIHLNPLRAGIVHDLDELDRYPWAGHSALLGNAAHPWQAMDEVLGQFGHTAAAARRRYRQFVSDGISRGRRSELQGGGLRRSAGGWEGVAALRRGRERWAADERILGSGPFVESVRKEAVQAITPWPRVRAATAMGPLIHHVATLWQLTPAEILGGSRRQPVPVARAAACAIGINHLGLQAAQVARALGISLPATVEAAARGQNILVTRKADVETLIQCLKKELG
jgi:hypothetical protein